MRRLPTLPIARMRVTSREGLLNTAVYRLRPTYWKTRSDSQKRGITQNRLLDTAYYWRSERAVARISSVAAGNFFPSAVVWVKSLAVVSDTKIPELSPSGSLRKR